MKRLCKTCGKPMTPEKWNSKVAITRCDNFSCPEYHRPQGESIPLQMLGRKA
jgi:hypothetical protein